jgi:DNA polymerase
MDFETFYGTGYTLSSMTNEEYIRDPRFEIIMCSFKMDENPCFWVPGPQVWSVLAKIPWHETAVISHHSHFDMAILNWIYGYRPAFILDTLPMFRALFPAERASLKNMCEVLGIGAKGTEVENARGKHYRDFSPQELARYGSYCVNDTERTREAFDIMKVGYPLSELQLNDMITRLFTEPMVELDRDLLILMRDDEIEEKRRLMEKLNVDRSVISSNPQFAALLLECGVDPPKKISPAWRKAHPDEDPGEEPVGLLPDGMKSWAYALAKNDEAAKELAASEDVLISALMEARFGIKSTIKQTRSQRFIGIAERGTFPIYLKAYAAHTGRLGGGDKSNAQNLTKKCSYCDGNGEVL